MYKYEDKASMKKEKRRVAVKLNRRDRKVELSFCNCPAGSRGYCNHVMKLLFEITDSSLHHLSRVPKVMTCTSRLSQ